MIANVFIFKYLSENLIMFENKFITMKRYYSLFTFFLIFFSFNTSAQNNILLLNGKSILTSKYQITKELDNDSILIYTNNKGKEKEVFLIDIFSVSNNQGKEIVFYQPNKDLGYGFSSSEMRSYVLGAQNARETYNPWWAGLTSFSLGCVSMTVPPLNGILYIGKFNIIYAPLIPASSTVVFNYTDPSFDKIELLSNTNKINAAYQYGYTDIAKQKRVKNSILGGIAGIITGAILYSAVLN